MPNHGDTTEITTDELDFDNPGGGGTNVTTQNDSTAYAVQLVEFKPIKGQQFGFDEYPPEIPQYLSEYKKKKVLEQEYIVPWQSAEANGKIAQVNMLIKTKVPDSINTRLKVVMNNQPLNFTASTDKDTIRILNLNGQAHKSKELITAYYINDEEKEIPIGYLNLVSYERQNFNLVIVPVDGEFDNTELALKTYLNRVYAPAITSWEVKKVEKLVVDYNEGEKNGLNTSRSFLSSFNKEMKAIIEAMKNRGDYSKENYYLFVMDKAENESLNGLMPFNSHFGFIFTGDKPTETKLFRTIAHELAHGAFKLKHNFDDKKTEKRSTQNLLDYTTTPETATVLRKFQWNEIISPRAIAFGWSEELYAEENWIPTVVLDIMKITSQTNNIASGFLNSTDKINQGAFIPVNNDDDDCDYKNDNDPSVVSVVGESDLLPIVIRGIGKGKGYYHFEANNNNIKIWNSNTQKNSTNNIPVKTVNSVNLTATETVKALTTDITLYIEGQSVGSTNLKLVWTKNSKGTGSRIEDNININIFEKKGSRYVPEKSIYQYEVTRSAGTGSWIAGNNCTLKSQTGNRVEIEWGNGPSIGQFIYQANANYFWNFETDIVKVEITQYTKNSTTYPYFRRGTNLTEPDMRPYFDEFGNKSAYFQTGKSTRALGVRLIDAAIIFDASIKLTGATANGTSNRGVEKMQIGWVQNARNGQIQTKYWDNTIEIPPGLTNNWFIDNIHNTMPVFMNMLNYTNTSSLPTGLSSFNQLSHFDSPGSGFRIEKPGASASPAHKQKCSGIFEVDFRLWICAITTDTEITTDRVYTPYTYSEWSFSLVENGQKMFAELYASPPYAGYIRNTQAKVPSIVTIPTSLTFWIRGTHPKPITTGSNMLSSPEKGNIDHYLDAF